MSKSLGGKILRDGDVLAMSIDDFEGQVDSVNGICMKVVIINIWRQNMEMRNRFVSMSVRQI